MQIQSETPEAGIIRIRLSGRLDLLGNQAIEMKFTALSATEKAGVLVDMGGVEYIASIGLRTLIANAKAQAHRGGKMVLLNPQPLVREVLVTTGVDAIIPVFEQADEALADLRAALA